jgi:hypothetical protein
MILSENLLDFGHFGAPKFETNPFIVTCSYYIYIIIIVIIIINI